MKAAAKKRTRTKRARKLVHVRFPTSGDVYNRAITFLYGSTAQINAVLERETPKGDEFRPLRPGVTAHFRVYVNNGYDAQYLCLIAENRGAIYEMSALAHEVFHHVAYTFSKVGLPLTDESEEAYCYYLEWLIRKCLNAIKYEPR